MRPGLLASSLLLAFSSLAAHADTVTEILSFTATGAGQTTVKGSYTLTFDPTKTYTNATSGLQVNSFSYDFSSAVALGFSYTPGGTLTIGGLVDGVGSVKSGTNDYYITFPSVGSVGVPTLEISRLKECDLLKYGKVSEKTSTMAAVTPEPSSLALLGTGLVGVFGVMRRRMASEAV